MMFFFLKKKINRWPRVAFFLNELIKWQRTHIELLSFHGLGGKFYEASFPCEVILLILLFKGTHVYL